LYCFIVNRKAGNGQALKVWKTVERLMRQKHVGYSLDFSGSKEEAAAIVQRLLSDNVQKVIVGVGGDGTMQSIIHEMARIRTDVPFSLIPAGTGNDLARALGISLDPGEALDCLLQGSIRTIDIGCAENRYFVTVLGVGFDGKVAQKVNGAWYKKLGNLLRLGKIAYIAGFFDVLLHYRPSSVHIRLDDRTLSFTDVWLIAIANAPNYGGGMCICPQADLTDGQLDICVIHHITRWRLLLLFPQLIRGNHIRHPSVTMLKGKDAQIDSDAAMIAYGDGEMCGETPIQVNIAEKALRIIIPTT
jgi:diacylglycerol kinase (ATP)